MKFTLTLNCDNEAFAEDPTLEIARLLRAVVERLEQDGARAGVLMDINGNRVGRFDLR